jgi:hypothetical protein
MVNEGKANSRWSQKRECHIRLDKSRRVERYHCMEKAGNFPGRKKCGSAFIYVARQVRGGINFILASGLWCGSSPQASRTG